MDNINNIKMLIDLLFPNQISLWQNEQQDSKWVAIIRVSKMLLAQACLDTFARSLQLSADSLVTWLRGAFPPSFQCLLFFRQDGCCGVVVATHDAYELMRAEKKTGSLVMHTYFSVLTQAYVAHWRVCERYAKATLKLLR